ncbi:MAG: hypothetical protein HOI15_18075 [Opitutales bacterium]|jgi:ferric-dicitrate binding protein FerR (iron transport regulator)|nr:hypothetical protein [Opitutales bacterium]
MKQPENSRPSDAFDRLLQRYQEKTLSEYELTALNDELRTSPENRAAFIHHCRLSQLIRDSQALAQATNNPKPKVTPFNSKRRRISIFAIGIAASLILVFNLLFQPELNPDSAPLATISQAQKARWANGTRVLENTDIDACVLELRRGLIRLDFANGARVSLQGPAKAEVLSPNNIRLLSGVLTAHIPEEAHGFTVDTIDANVVDLSTAFGVSVSEANGTDVCVFEGEVEVNLDQAEGKHRIAEGHFVRARASIETLEKLNYQTDLFEESWPMTSGVLQTTGLMKFVSPGPEFVPGKYEDDTHILVFPESRDVILDEAVIIDLDEPGEYRRWHRTENRTLAPGKRVRSYLLQLNPVGTEQRFQNKQTSVLGQITFDHPILGLIASSRKLESTDAALGHPDASYGNKRRGIEPPRREDGPRDDRDILILGADRRTLILNLGVDTAVDQIRVIVEETSIAEYAADFNR